MAWVVLTGYMGAGKSTAGRALAERLGVAFADSDAVIEEQAGLPIPRIFATKGEVWFRRMEERVIRDITASEPAGVLAVGGGAVESDRTRDVLSRGAHVAWLRVEPAALWTRVNGSDRPLASDEAVFLRRYERRIPAYTAVAAHVVDAARPVDAVVADLEAWARGLGAGGAS